MRVAAICFEAQDPASLAVQFVGQNFGGLIRCRVCESNVGPLLGEALNNCSTNAARSSSYEGDFAMKLHCLSFFVPIG